MRLRRAFVSEELRHRSLGKGRRADAKETGFARKTQNATSHGRRIGFNPSKSRCAYLLALSSKTRQINAGKGIGYALTVTLNV